MTSTLSIVNLLLLLCQLESKESRRLPVTMLSGKIQRGCTWTGVEDTVVRCHGGVSIGACR